MYRATTSGSNEVIERIRVAFLFGLMASIILFLGMKQGHAAFGLDFKSSSIADPGNTTDSVLYFQSAGCAGLTGAGACVIRGYAGAAALNLETTDWIYEGFTDSVTGQDYYHMVIGTLDPTAEATDVNGMIGFYQDVYIRMGTFKNYMSLDGIALVHLSESGNLGSLSDSGGFTSGFVGENGFNGSTITVDYANILELCEGYMGNGCDPLRADAVWSGNATGNPEKVLMRQINNDGAGFYTEFLKDVVDKKPRITQKVTDGDVSLEFQADMRSVAYNDDATTLAVSSTMGAADAFVNKLSILSVDAELSAESLKVGAANFDYAAAGSGWSQANSTYENGTEAGKSYLTASRYTWSPGVLAAASTPDPVNGSNYGWLNDAADITYEALYYDFLPGYDVTGFNVAPIYNKGSYAYFDSGSYDHLNTDWKFYLNSAENPCGGDPFDC